MADVATLSRIEDVLERIRPALHADGGDVELVDFDDEGFVHLQMLGACGGCPMSTATLTLGIEAELRRELPELPIYELDERFTSRMAHAATVEESHVCWHHVL